MRRRPRADALGHNRLTSAEHFIQNPRLIRQPHRLNLSATYLNLGSSPGYLLLDTITVSSRMQIDRYASWAALLLLGGTAGCAGNGQGLDQNGQPISAGGSGGPITADFHSIQNNVFTPICSKCHIGGRAPRELPLEPPPSYKRPVTRPRTG